MQPIYVFGSNGLSQKPEVHTEVASGTAVITEPQGRSYTGPKRINTGWTYDNHGNVTADPQGSMSVAWNVLDMPRTLTSGSASTQRSYLADGTLAQVYDGSTTRLYLGDMVFTRTGTSGTSALTLDLGTSEIVHQEDRKHE